MLLMKVFTLTFVFTNVLLKELKGPVFQMQPKLSTEGTQNFGEYFRIFGRQSLFQTRMLRTRSTLKHGAFKGKSAAKLDRWTSWIGSTIVSLFIAEPKKRFVIILDVRRI